MVHGFLLEGDRSVEAVAVTARVIMKQTADFLGKFVSSEICLKYDQITMFMCLFCQMHYSGEPVEVSTSQVEEQNLKDFDMKLTTCRTEAKLYMCINGQWV